MPLFTPDTWTVDVPPAGRGGKTAAFRLAEAKELWRTADAFFVAGGETFVLLSELQRTGQRELICARVLTGGPDGGSSAGANVAGLRIGTTNDFPTAEVVSRTAIGVFPAVINPHFPPMAPETKADDDSRGGKLKTYLKFNPDETVLARGNASVARWHAGRGSVMNGAVWLQAAAAVRFGGRVIGERISPLIGRQACADRSIAFPRQPRGSEAELGHP